MDPKGITLCIFGNILGVIGVITLNTVFITVAIVASITTIIYNLIRSFSEIKILINNRTKNIINIINKPSADTKSGDTSSNTGEPTNVL